RTRKNGYALSLEERVPGISTIAVPLFNHTGSVAAALSVTGPSSRVTRKRLLEMAPLAQEAAHAISANLGYLGEGNGSTLD
ncbi:MAG: IclR family transcriptional regulator domain-containing protein, partial [Actinomycetota bacterium]